MIAPVCPNCQTNIYVAGPHGPTFWCGACRTSFAVDPPKLATFNPLPSREEALASLDSLRKMIESGEMIAYAAVGIEPDDKTRFWCGASKPVTRLRLIGACAGLTRFVQDTDYD